MRPTFLGFETAKRGIFASQKSLDITNSNLANAETPGYTRQRLDLLSMDSSGYGSKYGPRTTNFAGQGVYSPGVAQIRDPFLDKRYRELNSTSEDAATTNRILTDVENVLDEISKGGLAPLLEDFRSQMQKLSTDSPDRVEFANNTMLGAKNITQLLRDFDFKTNQIYDHTKGELHANVEKVNEILQLVSGLNKTIKEDYFTKSINTSLTDGRVINEKYGPNELLDSRNLLLDQLSSYADFRYQRMDDGTVKVEIDGIAVVEGETFQKLRAKEINATKAVELHFESQEDGEFITLKGGTLNGLQKMLNGKGVYAEPNETFENGIPYYRKMIDNFASVFADTFNKLNNPNFATDGSRDMFVSGDGLPISAKNIQISDEWLNDPLMITSPKNGAIDNEHLLKMLHGFTNSYDFGETKATFGEYISYYTLKLGQHVSFSKEQYTSGSDMTLNVLKARDSVSGVSLTEEGTNMLNQQNWFNACSRMMTTMDEALNTIINQMGLVGR